MKNVHLQAAIIASFLLVFVHISSAQPGRQQRTLNQMGQSGDLLGVWQIDLRPDPESKPYFKKAAFATWDGKSLTGLFYDAPFSDGIIDTNWRTVFFSFTTADQSGLYYHSGYLKGDSIFGMTHSRGRNFLRPWRGVKLK